MAARRETQKAKAAAAEKNGKPNVIKWRGLEIALAKKTPGYLLLEDDADLTSRRGALRFIKAMIGEEQYRAVQAKLEEDDLDMDEAYRVVLDSQQSLFAKVAGALGQTVGESSASDSS